jgi:hypothetical protein
VAAAVAVGFGSTTVALGATFPATFVATTAGAFAGTFTAGFATGFATDLAACVVPGLVAGFAALLMGADRDDVLVAARTAPAGVDLAMGPAVYRNRAKTANNRS